MSPAQTVLVLFLAPLLLALIGALGLRSKMTYFPHLFSGVFVLGTLAFLHVLLQYPLLYGKLPFFAIDWVFYSSYFIDDLSLKMCTLVYFIASLVSIFSIEYMRTEKQLVKYYCFLGLFVFSMLGLVLVDNLWCLYIFWELVGFCSYLLIGFWYQKPAAISASKKAFLLNRVGDLCLLLGIFYFVEIYASPSFLDISNMVDVDKRFWVGLLLFGGCMAKSAQFPLHAWLPTAMEGPTPVSALIHAATMVAAGVYLAIRVFSVFTPDQLILISYIGAFTMLMGGVKALLQSDIKKVLAYSTVSQLGLMFVGLGQGFPDLTANYLLVHAFFKAGLFFGAGSVIHAIHHAKPTADAQDMGNMGGLLGKMPLTAICFFICAFSMLGLPLSSGFVVKELLLSSIFELSSSNVFGYLFVVGSFLSAAYMFRLLWLVFLKPSNTTESVHENSYLMAIPLVLLAGFSTQITTYLLDTPHVHWGSLAIIMLAVLALAGLLVYIFRSRMYSVKKYQSPIDWFYMSIMGPLGLNLAKGTKDFDEHIWDGVPKAFSFIAQQASLAVAWFDKNITDGAVHAFSGSAKGLGYLFRKSQTGQLQWYLSVGVLLLLILFYLI
jgi:NADH-quinone oxidoreductase subunit L